MIMLRLSDLFLSIQGEGPLCGVVQAFVRCAGCNLNCSYCDTDYSYRFSLSAGEIAKHIFEFGRVHSVSITGGEPLLQWEEMLELMKILKGENINIYLETNGVCKDEIVNVIDYVDWVAMDIKVPSVYGGSPLWQLHRDFLEAVKDTNSKIFPKIVMSNAVQQQEIDEIVCLLASNKRDDMIITLQPVWELAQDISFMNWLCDLALQMAKKIGVEVRVLPQVHKFLRIN